MPRFYKFKLLLDEGLPPRSKLPRVNSRYDLKHIRDDFKYVGLPDEKVYQKAVKMKRLIVVFNVNDYRDLVKISKQTGIIGVSQTFSFEQFDKKLNALLIRSKPGELFGKFTYISGETES
jgi:hypothetical protein